jgi:DNA polymerase III alpha subunit
MGLHASAQIVRDARAHGFTVLLVGAEASFRDTVREPVGDGTRTVRLGLRQIKGLREEDGH